MKGTLGTGEKDIVDGPRRESFIELVNFLNYDHGEEARKNRIEKKFIWYNEKVDQE